MVAVHLRAQLVQWLSVVGVREAALRARTNSKWLLLPLTYMALWLSTWLAWVLTGRGPFPLLGGIVGRVPPRGVPAGAFWRSL